MKITANSYITYPTTKISKKNDNLDIQANKPYYEDGKASLEYLKLAQQKLENDPTYNPINDRNLNLGEKASYCVFGALDPDLVEEISKEFMKNWVEIDKKELDRTLNSLNMPSLGLPKELLLGYIDSNKMPSVEELQARVKEKENLRNNAINTKEEIKQEEKEEQTEDKTPFEAIEVKGTSTRESMEDILSKINIQNIKDERDLLAIFLAYKNGENLYDKRV
ncbi:hypothetical protein KJQ97_01155 [Campylobacter sp. 2018MI01]|uniref:hypothetical protein n=1 Tax=Campylobacter sp. 2018MI01 TaxID=2836735 RepID=UPI001BDA0BA2|nr:hypothetical protein [Campylobacter sp. 2018MI01]MBT0878031.1 hypothetical protein [Campylobacter sp. 2018MI01]